MSEDTRLGVLIFHPSNVFGGAERTMMNFLTHRNHDRIRVVFVAKSEVFHNPVSDAFYSLTELGLAEGFLTIRRTFSDAHKLCIIARKERCRVVLGMLHYGAIIASVCRFLSGFKLWVIASPRTPSFEGIRFHVGLEGRQALFWRIMVNIFCRFSNRVLVASNGLRQECIGRYGAKPSIVRVIPNSIDDSLISRAKILTPLVLSRKTQRIVTVGRLVPEKDIGTLIRAFAKARVHCSVSLDIIGTGPEQTMLQELADDLGVADNISFLGFQEHPFEQIKQADIFVHTAIFEGFGNVLLEAMVCGVPVVATDCDFGPREIIQDGVNGRLVKVSNPDDLAKVIIELLNKPIERKHFAENALTSITGYSAELMAKRYEEVFLEANI